MTLAADFRWITRQTDPQVLRCEAARWDGWFKTVRCGHRATRTLGLLQVCGYCARKAAAGRPVHRFGAHMPEGR